MSEDFAESEKELLKKCSTACIKCEKQLETMALVLSEASSSLDAFLQLMEREYGSKNN